MDRGSSHRGSGPCLLVLVALSSCAQQQSVTIERPFGRAEGMRVAIHASDSHARYLQEALREVIAILGDPRFEKQLAGLGDRLLATTADDSCRQIAPLDVLKQLRAQLTGFDLRSRASALHWSSNAATAPCGPIDINTWRIDLWATRKSSLIQTVAHEMTHLLARQEGACGKPGAGRLTSTYTDDGHLACAGSGPACSDAFLVSYVWGDLVQCSYRVKGGLESCFESCVLRSVNDNFANDRKQYRFAVANKRQPVPAGCTRVQPWAPRN
jgi:hypothetical protein